MGLLLLYLFENAALGERLVDLRQATGTSGHMGKDPALRIYFSEGGAIYRVHVPRRFRLGPLSILRRTRKPSKG